MTTPLKKPLYTAMATVHGGRDGHGRSADGVLDLDIRPPVELGGPGGATNPEELFALGYAACFQSAMGVVGRRMKVDTSSSTVTGRVTLGTIEGGGFGLAVALEVSIPGVDADTAGAVVEAAHQVCPYSNATRGNIEVELRVIDASAGVDEAGEESFPASDPPAWWSGPAPKRDQSASGDTQA